MQEEWSNSSVGAETVNEKLYFQGNIAGKGCEQT